MQAQAYDGYVENGQFYPKNTIMGLPGRLRAVLTVLDVPVAETTTNPVAWLDEFNRLLAESGDEKLNIEDFPRANFTREHLEVTP
jgi:hypothetical protein